MSINVIAILMHHRHKPIDLIRSCNILVQWVVRLTGLRYHTFAYCHDNRQRIA
jgi:hypothetical protein